MAKYVYGTQQTAISATSVTNTTNTDSSASVDNGTPGNVDYHYVVSAVPAATPSGNKQLRVYIRTNGLSDTTPVNMQEVDGSPFDLSGTASGGTFTGIGFSVFGSLGFVPEIHSIRVLNDSGVTLTSLTLTYKPVQFQ